MTVETPAPTAARDDQRQVTVTVAELREGIRAAFYPAMPDWDDAGQDRIDRATVRVLEAMGL